MKKTKYVVEVSGHVCSTVAVEVDEALVPIDELLKDSNLLKGALLRKASDGGNITCGCCDETLASYKILCAHIVSPGNVRVVG